MIEEHYREHFDTLKKRAGYTLGDYHLGEDCVQSVYELVFRYFKSYDPEKGDFQPWFDKIYRNQLGRYRRFKSDKGIVKEFDLKEVEVLAPSLIELNQGLIEEEIDMYGHEYQREVLRLFIIVGYTNPEIADLLDMHPTAVRKTVSRFQQHLKSKYT